MAEENQNEETSTNLDDQSVLRVLLHTIQGISPVSSLQHEVAELDQAADQHVSYSD